MISRCRNFLSCLFLRFLVNIAVEMKYVIFRYLCISTWHSPHSGAVKMHHQPFARIKRNWIGIFYSLEPSTEFRAHECTACIGCVHVQPQSILFTCQFIRNLLTTELNIEFKLNCCFRSFFVFSFVSFVLLTHLTNFFEIVKSTGARCTQSSADLDKRTKTNNVKEIWFSSQFTFRGNIETTFDQACREF